MVYMEPCEGSGVNNELTGCWNLHGGPYTLPQVVLRADVGVKAVPKSNCQRSDIMQVRATRVGKDTALAQIVKLVEAAQMRLLVGV